MNPLGLGLLFPSLTALMQMHVTDCPSTYFFKIKASNECLGPTNNQLLTNIVVFCFFLWFVFLEEKLKAAVSHGFAFPLKIELHYYYCKNRRIYLKKHYFWAYYNTHKLYFSPSLKILRKKPTNFYFFSANEEVKFEPDQQKFVHLNRL